MTVRKLHESGTLAPKRAEGVYPIRIITEGKGSSGVYSRELLDTYKDVFANRPMFINHPKDKDKPWERELQTIAARTSENVEARDLEDGTRALFTEARVDQQWIPLMEKYGDLIGVSVYIEGDGKEVNGEYVVESFNPEDPYRSIDFVIAPGRGGRIEQMVESFRAIETSLGQPGGTGAASASTTTHNESEIDNMDELTKLVESLIGKIDSLAVEVATVKSLSENAAAAAGEKLDAIQVADEISKAVTEAKLPEGARKRVIAAVSEGTAVAEAVKTESEYIKNIVESIDIKPEAVAGIGRVVEGQGEKFSFKKIAEVTR